MSQSSDFKFAFKWLLLIFSMFVSWKVFTSFSLLIKQLENKTCLMLINNIRAEPHQHSHASVWRDHSAAPEDSAGSRPDLSPAPLFLPPSFNKTLIIFPQLCFSLFCFRPPLLSPASISAWLCQERDMRWHQNPEAVEAWGFFSTVTIEMLPWLERLS